MQYPLSYTFKIMALAPQIYVRDSSGAEVYYVQQKLFKLREDVSVFRDSSKSDQVGRITADRISDFNANYSLSNEMGDQIGSVGRKGMRSIFKAEYQIMDQQGIHALTLREDSMLVRILDSVVGGVPLIGFILAMLINPSYTVADLDDKPIFKITKKPAFFEGKFDVKKVGETSPQLEEASIMAIMMALLLERSRG